MIKRIDLRENALQYYVKHPHNKKIYDYIYKVKDTEQDTGIKDVLQFFNNLYSEVVTFYDNHTLLLPEVEERFKTLFEEAGGDNCSAEQRLYFLILADLCNLFDLHKTDKFSYSRGYEKPTFESAYEFYICFFSADYAEKNERLLNEIWLEIEHRYGDFEIQQTKDFIRGLWAKHTANKHLELEAENDSIKKTSENLLAGRKANMNERYKIMNELFDVGKIIRMLNVSDKEKYHLLSIVLDCNPTNARQVMNGNYPGKVRESEIEEYVQSLLG